MARAVFVWWLNERFELGYDLAKLFRAAICHDSHEGHSPGGDVAAFFKHDHPLNDPLKRNKEKERREAIGMRNLEEAVGDIFPAFIKTLKAYDERATAEERLVYAADKFLDSLLVVDDNGRTNHLIGTTLAEHHTYKGPKCAADPTVAKLYQLLHAHCIEHESELFPTAPRA